MSNMMPLSMAPPDQTVEVVAVKAGWGLQRELADMGLIPGVKVKIVNRLGHGPVVIDVRGSKLALGHGVAHKIMVI